MALLILIEGLTAEGDPLSGGVLPIFDRLAATGKRGRVLWDASDRRPEEGGPHFALFGQTTPEKQRASDWPLGFATALAAGMTPDPKRTWCQLDFTHLYRKRDELVFLSPERTGLTGDERWTLAKTLEPDIMAAGWTLHGSPDTPTLLSNKQRVNAHTWPMSLLEGESFWDRQPTGEEAKPLLHLLNNTQMALTQHPLNQKRRDQGRMVLNTPWIWGIGPGWPPASSAESNNRGSCLTTNPPFGGLALAAGFSVSSLDEQGEMTPLLATLTETLPKQSMILHVQAPAIFARHGLHEQRKQHLARLNQQLLQPLVVAMAAAGHTLVIASGYPLSQAGTGTTGPVPWVAASAKQLTRQRRFWHRGRAGTGRILDARTFGQKWLP